MFPGTVTWVVPSNENPDGSCIFSIVGNLKSRNAWCGSKLWNPILMPIKQNCCSLLPHKTSPELVDVTMSISTFSKFVIG